MIMFMIYMYLLGGHLGAVDGGYLTQSDVKQLSKQVRAVVVDRARANSASKTLSKLSREVKGFEKTFLRSGKQMAVIYQDHSARSDRMLAVLDELNSEWEAKQTIAVDLRFEFKASLTEEEWNSLFPDD